MEFITKNMKILYIITKSNWGGAQKYIFDLATSLSQDHEIVVVHGGDGELVNKLKEASIKTIRVNSLDRDISFLDEIKSFKKLIDIFGREKPDVVHLNSSKIGGLGSLAGRIAGVKQIVFTAHGFAFNEDRPDWQKFVIKILTYITIILTHKTIVISKKELKQVEDWLFVSKKVSLIYNGISKIDFLEREEAREFLIKKVGLNLENKKGGLSESPQIWIGTISELTRNKGLKYGVKAIKKLKENIGNKWNGVFMIIGSGEERGCLENLIREEGLEKDVFLAGFAEDAQRYLKAFDIFLLSSVKEGLPYVLLEAGQAGNAIISTEVGGIGEIIDDKENGILVRPKKKKDIARALETYIKNPEKVEKFGEKIQTKIEEKFSKEKMVKKTLELYS